MNDQIEIYLELSEEVRKLLALNNISINEVLRKANIGADISYAESPFVTDEAVKTRDIVTVIAVSAVAFSLVAPAFVKIINSLKNSPEIARETWFKLEPVINPKTGEVLRDKKGELIFNKVPQLEISQIRPQESKSEVKLDIFNVLKISLSSEDKEISK
ncbi:MAG: hypothetical protein PHI13_02995 [Methylococcales bacterium]|nr:hypothetical protein [Methylococcales bacterium]